MTKGQRIICWILQLIVAGILFQTLFFKFSGAEESKYIFSRLGAEPWGRIGSGIIEAVTVILLLVPSTVTVAAALALATSTGAILSHLTKLGVVVQGDGGLLFGLAMTIFVLSLVILVIRRAEIPVVGTKFFGGNVREAHRV